MASNQSELEENDPEGIVSLSPNLSNATWNDDHSDDEPIGDEFVLVGIERTVSKRS